MSHVGDYKALVKRHTEELDAWIAADPANLKALQEANGRNTAAAYLDEYSYKWGITYYLADDIGFPEASRFREELRPYDDLEEVMG